MTEADREKARELALLARSGVGGPSVREGAIVQALADEREKARAAFLALADELDVLADEHWCAYKGAPSDDPRRGNPYTEGVSDAYTEAAVRIRTAARDAAEQ